MIKLIELGNFEYVCSKCSNNIEPLFVIKEYKINEVEK